MFCPNCGREVPAGTVCPCQAQGSPPQPPLGAPGNFEFRQGFYPPQVNNTPATEAVAVLRKHGSSNLMMVFAILLSVGGLLSIISIFFNTGNMYENIQYGLNGYMNGSVNSTISVTMKAWTTFIGIFGLLPSLLTILGVWLFYRACKSPKTPYISTGGLMVVKVIAIINFILMALACLVFMVFFVFGISAVNGHMTFADEFSVDASMITVVVSVLVGIMAGILAFGVLYFVFLLKTINAVKQTASTGLENVGVSMFTIVICFISGGFSLLSSFALLSSGVLGIAAIVTAAASILIGVVLFNYRKEMLSLVMKNSPQQYMNGQYIQAPQAPVYPPQNAVPQLMVCPNCGVSYDPRLNQCPNCGMPNPNLGR